jgi:hypothetical protein
VTVKKEWSQVQTRTLPGISCPKSATSTDLHFRLAWGGGPGRGTGSRPGLGSGPGSGSGPGTGENWGGNLGGYTKGNPPAHLNSLSLSLSSTYLCDDPSMGATDGRRIHHWFRFKMRMCGRPRKRKGEEGCILLQIKARRRSIKMEKKILCSEVPGEQNRGPSPEKAFA